MPLASVRVLDLSRILAGPFAAQALADLGADVIKVERPGVGDETRRWGPPFHDGVAAYFYAINRNRRAIELDYMTPEGARALRNLAPFADLVIENFLPHQYDQLGMPELRAACPNTVWLSIRGAAGTGPLGKLPGFDAMVQARSGLMSLTGLDTESPTKVGVPIADIVTGLYAGTRRAGRAAGSPRASREAGCDVGGSTSRVRSGDTRQPSIQLSVGWHESDAVGERSSQHRTVRPIAHSRSTADGRRGQRCAIPSALLGDPPT